MTEVAHHISMGDESNTYSLWITGVGILKNSMRVKGWKCLFGDCMLGSFRCAQVRRVVISAGGRVSLFDMDASSGWGG